MLRPLKAQNCLLNRFCVLLMNLYCFYIKIDYSGNFGALWWHYKINCYIQIEKVKKIGAE